MEMEKNYLVYEIQNGFRILANAITAGSAMGSNDATGVHVESLTESNMGITAALVKIAESIIELADAVRGRT